jgi:hypothetical protein
VLQLCELQVPQDFDELLTFFSAPATANAEKQRVSLFFPHLGQASPTSSFLPRMSSSNS